MDKKPPFKDQMLMTPQDFYGEMMICQTMLFGGRACFRWSASREKWLHESESQPGETPPPMTSTMF